MAKPIFLLGGGGHGSVLLNTLLENHLIIGGILDPNLTPSLKIFDVAVLGSDEYLKNLLPSEIWVVNGVGANPYTQNRKALFEKLKAKNYSFYTLRHSSTIVGFDCELAEGVQILAGVVIQNRVRIGENAVINTRAIIEHNCTIGAHAFISPGVVMCGGVSIEESAFIGAGAVLLPDIQVKKNAVVGAGSVVTKTVPEGAIMKGNPAIRSSTTR